MNTLRKKILLTAVVLAILVAGQCFFGTSPATVPVDAALGDLLLQGDQGKTHIKVPGADTFDSGRAGIYICRPQYTLVENSYWGSVRKEVGSVISFDPIYQAKVMQKDTWVPLEDDYNAAFRVQKVDGGLSAIWTLQETAPAGIYGVSCIYPDGSEMQEDIFVVAYTDTWSYVTVAQDATKETYLTNFYGGWDRSLNLRIGYNDGATVLAALEEGEMIANRVRYGAINDSEIVTNQNLKVTLSTMSGKVYDAEQNMTVVRMADMMTIYFDEPLEKDIYLLQVSSMIESGTVYGQIIINNRGSAGNVNRSRLWVILMIVGGFLMLGGAIVFMGPILVVKINENRVYRENMRVAKAKNPEAFQGDVGGGLMARFKNKVKNLKPKNTETEETDRPRVENKQRSNRLSDMIKSNQENRVIAQNNPEAIARQEQEKNEQEQQAIQKNSFAFLRDDDDEIASLYEEKEEAPTIETGAYRENGVTFSKLDSLKDDTDPNAQG